MSSTLLRTFRPAGSLLLLASLLLAARASQAQPVSPAAGLPSLTAAFSHTSVVSVAGTLYDFNYYDFNLTGFTNVGAGNPVYGIFSFSNPTLEKLPGVVGVAAAYLPLGWTFDDTHDFDISTGLIGVYPDDPQFGLIFIQRLNTTPINPTGAPFTVYHQNGGVDPFTLNGVNVIVPVNAPVPEAPTSVSLGLLLLGGLVVAVRRRSSIKKVS